MKVFYWRKDARRRKEGGGGLRCGVLWCFGCLVLCVSLFACLLLRLLSTLFSCAVMRRTRARARASACLVHHCHFSSVLSIGSCPSPECCLTAHRAGCKIGFAKVSCSRRCGQDGPTQRYSDCCIRAACGRSCQTRSLFVVVEWFI